MKIELNYQMTKSFKETYDVKNDKCPICDKKFETLLGGHIVKFKDKAYHYDCWLELKNTGE